MPSLHIILHDENVQEQGIDVIIPFSKDWIVEWGGLMWFTNGDGEHVSVSTDNGCITIMDRGFKDQNFQMYIEKANHYSENSAMYYVHLTIQ